MFERTKLLYQAAALVAVPLIFELGFVFALTFMLLDLERTLVKEAHAKRVIVMSADLMRKTLSAQVLMIGLLLNRDQTASQRHEAFMYLIERECGDLEELVRDDPKAAALATSIHKYISKSLDLFTELKESIDMRSKEISFAQYLHEGDFWSDMLYCYTKNATALHDILDYYGRNVKAIEPHAQHMREMIKFTIALAVLVNIALALALASCFSQTTVRRLGTLMNNVHSFGKGQKQLVAVSGTDEIAELDQAFREMADARERAEQLRKDMVAMVSHDLRTPLSSLVGYMEMFLAGVYGEVADHQRKVMVRLDSEIKRLARLANDLLDMEKIESGALDLQLSATSVAQIITDSTNAIKAVAELRELTINVDYPPNAAVFCDPDRIVQVIINLLSNATKFAPQCSEIRLDVNEESDLVRFAVTDKGPGVPLEQQAIVFDRFKQLAQPDAVRKQGSGLGLAICKSLVEAHGGQIGVTSVPGSGACFWFTLPRHENLSAGDKT